MTSVTIPNFFPATRATNGYKTHMPREIKRSSFFHRFIISLKYFANLLTID